MLQNVIYKCLKTAIIVSLTQKVSSTVLKNTYEVGNRPIRGNNCRLGTIKRDLKKLLIQLTVVASNVLWTFQVKITEYIIAEMILFL